MFQTIPISHDEKVKMYSKLSKREIIEMLIANQRLVDITVPQRPFYETKPLRAKGATSIEHFTPSPNFSSLSSPHATHGSLRR